MTVASVAFLIDYFEPFEVGGAERSARALADALDQAGVRVTVITPNFGARSSDTRYGVAIRRLPFPQRLQPGQLARRVFIANPALHAIYGLLVARILRRDRIDVLHVQNSPMVVAGAIACRLSRRPMILTIRDLGYLRASEHDAHHHAAVSFKQRADEVYAHVERWMKRQAARRARTVVFVSNELHRLYEASSASELTRHAKVVYNIGPEPAARPPEGVTQPRVLFVGKLSAGKGLHVLYDAMQIVLDRIPGATLELAGQPGIGWSPPPPAIRDRVHLHGRIPASAVEQLMRDAALVVSPSVWPEPLSRVLLEAMSRGVPIVGSDVGGTAEAVGNDGALLVPPGDPLALADAITRLLRDPDLAARLSRHALDRYCRTFTRSQIVPEMLDVYSSSL